MPPYLAITGPTAVGKTSLSLGLAERLGAEIVSVDSRQIYRGMDIGTAKPTDAERVRAPHHFIDERDPSDPITVGQFARAAEDRVNAIISRGSSPLLVGGSMLYLHALVHGLADLPPVGDAIRDAVRAQSETPQGREALFAELSAGDPRAAATLDPSKSQRLARLVSVLRSSGPPSALWDGAPPPRHTYRVVALNRPRQDLYARINARVHSMVDAGLIEETQALLDTGYDPDQLPLRTIGYREAAAHLRGELDRADMIRRIQRNTRRYAKRQLTWLRRDASVVWVQADATAEDVLSVTRKSA